MRTAIQRARSGSGSSIAGRCPHFVLPPRSTSAAYRWASSSAATSAAPLEADANGAGPSRISMRREDTRDRWAHGVAASGCNGEIDSGSLALRRRRHRNLPENSEARDQSRQHTIPPSHSERQLRPSTTPSDLVVPPSYFSGRSTTSRSHMYPPDSDYGRIVSLPRSTAAEDALDMLPPGEEPPPPYVLSAILSMRMNVPALARILPLISRHASSQTQNLTVVRARLDALAVYLGACTRLKGYIYLRPAVDLALQGFAVLDKHDRMNAKDSHIAARRMLARYHRLLTCMVDPAWVSRPRPTSKIGSSLPLPVQDEVSRVVVHVLAELDGMGCSLAERESTLAAFFGPFMTSHTLDPVMAHVKAHGVTLHEAQWRRAAAVAFDDGKRDRGARYLARAAAAYSRHIQQLEGVTEHEAPPEGHDHITDAFRIMGARAARTFNEALENLSPLVTGRLESKDHAPRTTASHSENQEASTLDSDPSPTVKPPAPPPPPLESSEAPPPSSLVLETAPVSEPTATSRDKPRKQVLNPHEGLSRAWSVLLTRAAMDEEVSNDDLFRLVQSVPDVAVCAATLTPALHGMTARDDLERALTVWRAAQERYTRATRRVREVLFDAALLSVAADMRSRVAQAEGLNAVNFAIKTVDYYAARPAPRADGSGAMDIKAYAKVRHGVPLDTGALNMLFRICVRCAAPSVAFRLWSVADERWGVHPNEASLASLLDAARAYTVRNQDTMENRVQMMKDTFSFRALGTLVTGRRPAALNVAQNANAHETRALFDPPGYTWRAEYGPTQPVDVARGVFEDIIFSNWPDLQRSVPSPIQHGGTISELAALISPRRLASAPPAPTPTGTKFAHLVPGPRAWDAYIKLIAYHFPDEDLPLRLAYMRALGVIPSWNTMLVALKMIGEREGPRMRVATPKGTMLMRDEQAVRAYLEDWLGDDPGHKVPSELDVAEFRRKQEAHRAEFVRQRILHEQDQREA